ncbi:MAG: chemotaxis protein CheX [Desulfobacterales bacterium]|nr:chemotaxis protein CheX [Desulfobacterales bacterium]
MKVELINPFIVATLSVLETSSSITTNPLDPYVKKDDVALGCVTGLINLNGEYTATVAITFTDSCILKIVSNMFGEEITKVDEDIFDAVGELSNMIAGQVSLTITEFGESLKATFDKVLSDNNHKIEHIVQKPVLAVPFSTESGEFTIEVSFKE